MADLVTLANEFQSPADRGKHEVATMSPAEAGVLLVISTAMISWMAEVLVHSVEEAARDERKAREDRLGWELGGEQWITAG